MEDPIKIIHKYKNSDRRIQYQINIFIGDIVDDSCMKVLKSIKDLDLYSSLTNLDEKERNILTKNYGEWWYEKFYNSHHINFTKDTLKTNTQKSKELKEIYGNDWYNIHIIKYKARYETSVYSYEKMVKLDKERKTLKYIIRQQKTEMDEVVDYTYNSQNTDMNRLTNIPLDNNYNIYGTDNKPYKIINTNAYSKWCQEESSSDEEEYTINSSQEQIGGDDEEDDNDLSDFDQTFLDNEAFEDEISNQNMFDLEGENNDDENIKNLFDTLDVVDKNLKQNTLDLKAAISNEHFMKLSSQITAFNTDKDTNSFDENLKNVYSKNYIVNQYIFKDDTIRTIKNKICCGFKNNNKFGDDSYIIPSYQYLWSEYTLENKIEQVMLGQKWVIKNDLLKLDIEPNSNLAVYEDMRGNLKMLRDNIKRQGKIKREDDENSILFDYENYYTYNEIYMIDIYNEFGLNYDVNFEEAKNLLDVYLKIYFPHIKSDDLKNIITYLKTDSNNKNNEKNKIKILFDTINNDIMLENEISRDIELVKKKNKDYVKIFKENYVTQSVIRAYLLSRNKKLDLFRIFDSFNLDATYPFIQYQPADGSPRFRFNINYVSEEDKKEIIIKWFENSIPGLSFRVKINNSDRYMGINLNDNGQISYKIQWKEEDKSTVDDIKKTYNYVINLIKKINRENSNIDISLHIPNENEFKFAFINTIQKFELPNDFVINHNDISEFSRYFFPYVALVIEPRKRQSKISVESKTEKSKYGTYFRYKKVSKYENKSKIEHRIIFFMRNYEYDDNSLANEISKEFNITNEQSLVEINSVREKFPGIRKARKILKKLENIPKYKPPGIEVAIQGKLRSKYKMKIAGARDREQLNRIITFMNILIYLYVETYLYKRPNRQQMKDKLKRLVKIAKRRNKVDDFIKYDTTTQNVKQMISIDKKRLSYKADEDQNQWTRNCQNSGHDKKRRPQLFLNVDELKKIGYEWNDKLGEFQYGHYERTLVESGKKSKNKPATKLIALKLPLDDTGEKFVYYTCGPEENGQHMYIGFLGKSKNPYGEGVPCCFIKDHLYSKNTEKRNFFLKSIGIKNEEDNENKISGDQLYILQDSAKIQEGRFAFLPKYLEIYLNYMFNHQNVIKNRYLLTSKTGYYFKYGSKQVDNKYLNAISAVLDISVENIITHLLKKLQNDKNLILFTSLKSGDIRTQFQTLDEYINYIKTNNQLDYDIINDLLCLPGVLHKEGLNIIIFNKKTKIIKKNFDKVKTKDDYYILCNNIENTHDLYNKNRENILLIKESKNFYPIIFLKKISEQSKEIELTKTYMYNNDDKNIINHILKYYKVNCDNYLPVLGNVSSLPNARTTYNILQKINSNDLNPRGQIIDTRFKCIYIVTRAGYIVPTIPSGCVYNLNIINNIIPYLSTFNETYKYMNNIYDISKGELPTKPVGVHYSECTNKKYNLVSLITNSGDFIPIKNVTITLENIKKLNLTTHHKPNNDIIDKEIQKGIKSTIDDRRVTNVAQSKYDTELYQLFRYHLSYYLNNTENGKSFRNEIINTRKTEDKRSARIAIKQILYKMSDSKLYSTFVKLTKNINKIIDQDISTSRPTNLNKSNDWIHIQSDKRKINYTNYKINNNREMCYLKQKDACSNSQNCIWSNVSNMCILNVQQKLFIDFINRVTEEFMQNGLLSDEILKNGDYFVSDIVNFNIHTERPGEQVIVSSNINAEKLLSEIFGKNNVPKIGKKNTNIDNIASYDQLNYENPMKYVDNWYQQPIINSNNTVYRAFANSYFWVKHKYNDPTYRNLGYYSNTQSVLSNLYKSQVIDWLKDSANNSKVKLLDKYIQSKNIEDLIYKLSSNVETITNCIVELFILSEIYNIIINVYDDNYKILFMLDSVKSFIYDSNNKSTINNKKMNNINETINLLMNFSNSLTIPSKIICLYSK